MPNTSDAMCSSSGNLTLVDYLQVKVRQQDRASKEVNIQYCLKSLVSKNERIFHCVSQVSDVIALHL